MNYPQLHLPKDFLDNIDKVFLPPVKPILPVAPEKPSKLELLKILFPLIMIGIFIFFAKQNTLGMLFIAPCIFLLFSSSDRKKYEDDLRKYNKAAAQYPKLLSQHTYEMEILKVDPGNYQDYKRNIENDRILNRAAAHFHGKDYKKGKAHDYFNRFLHRSFGNKIIQSACIEDTSLKPYHNGVSRPYVTDFAYIDPHINLRIDIEIDEPYDLEHKKPIHLDDHARNEFFTRNSWVVVRFAEEQVVLYPELCCKYLDEIINAFCNDLRSLKDFRHNLPEIKKWDFLTAAILISKDHRDTYLDGRVYYKL